MCARGPSAWTTQQGLAWKELLLRCFRWGVWLRPQVEADRSPSEARGPLAWLAPPSSACAGGKPATAVRARARASVQRPSLMVW